MTLRFSLIDWHFQLGYMSFDKTDHEVTKILKKLLIHRKKVSISLKHFTNFDNFHFNIQLRYAI